MRTTIPLYQRLKTELRNRILSGELVPGSLLPSEVKLADDYDCSRLTAHRALRELANEGVVERRRRAGTRVAMRAGTGLSIQIPRITEEIASRGFAYRYELLIAEFVVPPKHIAERLDIGAGKKLLHIKCRHWAGKRVFQYEKRWINTSVVPKIKDVDFRYSGPSQWLIENVPLSELEHEVSAIAASVNIARIMKMPENAPILKITRRTTWKSQYVTNVDLLHPGDIYCLRPFVAAS